MTISTTASRISYTGNGSTDEFSFPYPVLATTDLVVIETIIATGVETVQVITTDYTVALVGGGATATVTAVTAPASTVTWTIYRDPAQTQGTDFTDNDPLPAASIEDALDRLTMIEQRSRSLVDRSLKQPEGDAADIDYLPSKVDRASKYLVFDADGDPTVSTGTGTVSSVSTAMIEDDAVTLAKMAGGTDGNLITYDAAGNPAYVATGTAAQVLTSNGAGAAPTFQTQAAVAQVPTGAVLDYAGTSAPTGYLFCYGQDISRTTYADLFSAVSTTYGVGDGSTTFGLPDLRGRVVAGKDDMGGASANRLTDLSGGLNGDTLGDSGGAEAHTLLSSESGLPAHTHAYNDEQVAATNDSSSGSTFGAGSDTARVTSANSTADASAAHNNVQPTFILNKIIKT
jgi:microcystin-dependent protein